MYTPAEIEAPQQMHRNIKTQLSTERDRKAVREKPGDSLSERDTQEECTDLNYCDRLKCLEINCALYPVPWIRSLATHCSFRAVPLHIYNTSVQPVFMHDTTLQMLQKQTKKINPMSGFQFIFSFGRLE